MSEGLPRWCTNLRYKECPKDFQGGVLTYVKGMPEGLPRWCTNLRYKECQKDFQGGVITYVIRNVRRTSKVVY
ncbi:hypothetical protein DPMN_078494 [Dreissena polymorpha]|uniref:Uncharacterized protein n=1 Tax=Dreissena polymorpha TaxID=45954 RepID=A0A9D4BQA2_DREPO|nr:hypothetical protein DPMN_078494 [Dreissena polymorpha]